MISAVIAELYFPLLEIIRVRKEMGEKTKTA
jgi:hypothetical protein